MAPRKKFLPRRKISRPSAVSNHATPPPDRIGLLAINPPPKPRQTLLPAPPVPSFSRHHHGR
ncbi:hypothetical protein E2562_006177 [Oryza meyeriana var. granulata]|uniref:Uncharacterized protein n=1 Tax=Oryza meyeriana var. granulata TaxID=110450 RepID=A0A6G1CNN9_9ORYZ|nr:hypothetical protein E2562_006177 [Oryza meyeriana var. granulata]